MVTAMEPPVSLLRLPLPQHRRLLEFAALNIALPVPEIHVAANPTLVVLIQQTAKLFLDLQLLTLVRQHVL